MQNYYGILNLVFDEHGVIRPELSENTINKIDNSIKDEAVQKTQTEISRKSSAYCQNAGTLCTDVNPSNKEAKLPLL